MDAQTITAICTVAIAIAALGFTAWQAYVTRKHNRLSVRPCLVFYRNVTDKAPRIQIVLRNSGLGPAFTTDFRVSINSRPLVTTIARTWGNSVVTEWGMSGYRFEAITPDRKGAIAPNEELIILSVEAVEEPAVLQKKVHQLDIEVDYESAYKEKFKVRLNNDL